MFASKRRLPRIRPQNQVPGITWFPVPPGPFFKRSSWGHVPRVGLPPSKCWGVNPRLDGWPQRYPVVLFPKHVFLGEKPETKMKKGVAFQLSCNFWINQPGGWRRLRRCCKLQIRLSHRIHRVKGIAMFQFKQFCFRLLRTLNPVTSPLA